MNCKDKRIRNLIANRLDAELTGDDKAAIAAHVASCSECRSLMEDKEWVMDGLKALVRIEIEDHPDPEQLISYVDEQNTLDTSVRERVELHLLICDRCAAEVTILRELNEQCSHPQTESRLSWSVEPHRLETLTGKIVLLPLGFAEKHEDRVLAADTPAEGDFEIHSIATLYSESPEIVLRVMRDPERGVYLQAVGEGGEPMGGIIVVLPELDREFITDDTGHASLQDVSDGLQRDNKWQIKLPEATFDLELMTHHPEEVDYSEETILETERSDKIQVLFEGKADAKQITLRVLQLDGRSEFGQVKVLVSQAESRELFTLSKDQSGTFALSSMKRTIRIRLFQ